MKNIFLNVLKISLAAGLIFYLVRNNHIDVPGLLQSLWGPQLLLYLVINLILYVLMTKRLQLILLLSGVRCDYPSLLKYNFIGAFFNFALPGSVSGDVVKGVYIAKHAGVSKARALFSALLDRTVALYTFILGGCLVVFLPEKLWLDSYVLDFLLTMMIVAFVSVTLAVFVAARLITKRYAAHSGKTEGRTARYLHEFAVGAQTFLRSPKQLFYILFLSLLGQVLYVWMFMMISDQLTGSHLVGYWTHFFVQSVGLMLVAIPISPAGIGVGQAVFHFLYGEILGTTSSLGATAISVVQILNLAMGLIGAYFFVLGRKKKDAPEIPAS